MKTNEYEVKGVKTFRGHDGDGFNATLYRKGRKVAFVIDDAWGGSYQWEWFDRDAERADVRIHGIDKNGADTVRSYKGTPEEARLAEHVLTLPSETHHGMVLHKDLDWFVSDLVADFEVDREIRRILKRYLVFVTENGIIRQYDLRKIPEKRVRLGLQVKYPAAKIVNDMDFGEAKALLS